MTTEPKTYTTDELDALGAEDVEKLAAVLGVAPETGSGANGNVVKVDRVKAILASQEAGDQGGDGGTLAEGDGREKFAVEATPDGTGHELAVEGDAAGDAGAPEIAPHPSDRVEIARTDARGWWCPICDYSHPHLAGTCTGCGAVRDGDEVIARAG